MSQPTPDATTPPTFEAILRDLEAVVLTLEKGEVPLEEALEAFERGTALAKTAGGILDRAEARVAKLVEDRDGTLREAPLDAR